MVHEPERLVADRVVVGLEIGLREVDEPDAQALGVDHALGRRRPTNNKQKKTTKT